VYDEWKEQPVLIRSISQTRNLIRLRFSTLYNYNTVLLLDDWQNHNNRNHGVHERTSPCPFAPQPQENKTDNLPQIFRILGDVSHTLSKCILIYSIHSNSSAEGVSLITQAFYCLVFASRYLDFFSGFTYSIWNTSLKAFYILSSVYILFIMLRVYARTREREKAWKLGGACLAASVVLSPFVMLIFRRGYWGWVEVRSFTLEIPRTSKNPILILWLNSSSGSSP